MHTQLDPWQWALLVLGAFLVGLAKTGIAGIGILAVAIFALILPTRESVGVVLLILIAADIVAVTAYRRHAVWSHLWRLFPWAAIGVMIGFATMGRINDAQVAKLIGGILITMVVFHYWRRWNASQLDPEEVPHGFWFAAVVGILAGFTTMIANAAGPIMILYLLAMRLPKMEFIGTAAWFFLTVNLFKVPFSSYLGLINPSSFLLIDLRLAPVAVVGALSGRALIPFINQALFENLALIFTLVAGLWLLF